MIEEIMRFTCPCCGELTDFKPKESFEFESGIHHIDLGVAGYGSTYDGLDIKFNVCDNCLKKWIESFKVKPHFIIEDSKKWEEMKKAYGQED